MKNDIRLFIGGEEVEFSQDPKILLNYKETELHNPTIIRNSFSKQITIEGTNRNNDIFGHIWELTRIQDGNFNPIQKTDFQLFVNDELFQKGYCKLDKVTRTNNTTQYALTLYGGLGSFFFNLAYDQDDSSNAKKTLASLKFSTSDSNEPDLDFIINKENVNIAWGQITSMGDSADPRWNVINFIPALNGIPGDFDASKVLINYNGLNTGGASGFLNGKTESGVTYYPVLNGGANQNGYGVGEMPSDLQEWQTRDLRSYNQRPVLSMYRFIQACTRPENNGGYQVKLDDHFFHGTNPYYRDAWVTLPMLKDLDGIGGGETYKITGATITPTSSTQYSGMFPVSFNSPALGSLNNVNMSVSVRFNPTGGTTPGNNLYPFHTYSSPGTTLTGNRYVRNMEVNQGVIIQLFAFNQGGQVVAQSKAYLLGGQKYWFDKDRSPMWEWFWLGNNDYGTQPEYEFVEGYFKLINGAYQFVNMAGQKTNINFSFQTPNNFAGLMVKVSDPYGEYAKYAVRGAQDQKLASYAVPTMYNVRATTTSGNHTLGEAEATDRVVGKFSFIVESMDGIATDYEGLFSGTKITKERLLTTEYSPADYLLSYCKMFGLYFYYDSTEEADDPVMYPSGVVHIMDRDTFYTDEIVNLERLIDWNKKVEITPAMADSKWYKFDVEHVESELETGYAEQYGYPYGCQLVNTNYNFNSDTKNLYDGNVFKSAIMALEKDKFYKKSPVGLPIYQYNGLTYNLFNRTATTEEFSTVEIQYPVSTTMNMLSINPDYEFYDAFPKLQLHAEENSPVDGANVLVFYKGSVQAPADYWLTDDVGDMVTLNDGSPCWILTRSETDGAGNTIAKKINYFPFFTRDLILYGQSYGNIVHSWNFGHPQVVYSPDTYTTDGDSVYDIAWRDYIRDVYSVNTRKLSCYVRAEMDGRPWPYWLRRFYWFQNSIWRLNEIKDLNVGSFDTTKMEFIKVQDMDNYKLEKIEYEGHNEIVITTTEIPCAGGTVYGYVYEQSAGGWYATDYINGEDGEGHTYGLESAVAMSPSTGRGAYLTNFTITVPPSTAQTPITWTVSIEDDFDNWYRATFIQDTCNTASTISVSPSTQTVGTIPGSATYTITAVRVTGITASSSDSWVSPSINGNTLTVNYNANDTANQRTATITVSGTGNSGPVSTTVSLVQRGLGSITAAPADIYLDYGAGIGATTAATFQVITDDAWTSTIEDIDN